MYVYVTPIWSNANRIHPSFCVSIQECISAMRGSETACFFTVSGDVAATPVRPSAAIASRALEEAFSTMYVPFGYSAVPILNAESAMLTFAPLAFHGRTADLQAPRCFTTIVPLAGTDPFTEASPFSICIGLPKML